jgi:hypothetical protein
MPGGYARPSGFGVNDSYRKGTAAGFSIDRVSPPFHVGRIPHDSSGNPKIKK